MSDKGKTAAMEQPRKEVGFGCPVCRSPFLTWHHFDPPWHVEQHWRPEGIIALCREHHDAADARDYSPAELRAMKKTPYRHEDVQAHFISWQKKVILVRMGSLYTNASGSLFSVNGIPQLALKRNEADLLLLSFELRNEYDEVLVKMTDNWFEAYPPNLHDLTVTPKTKDVKVWLDKEDVGLELSFDRITMEKLGKILAEDREHTRLEAEKENERMPPELQEYHRTWFRQSSQQPDVLGYRIKKWAEGNCVMDDGLIPFLNVEKMAIYFHGRRLDIADRKCIVLRYSLALDCVHAIHATCGCWICSGFAKACPYGGFQVNAW
jgi:hypothetical protein